MHEIEKITNCGDCPLKSYNECDHPLGKNDFITMYELTTFPDWCPLKEKPLLVMIEER